MTYRASRNGFSATFPRNKMWSVRSAPKARSRRRRDRRSSHYSPSFFIAIGVTLLSSVAFVGILAMALSTG